MTVKIDKFVHTDTDSDLVSTSNTKTIGTTQFTIGTGELWYISKLAFSAQLKSSDGSQSVYSSSAITATDSATGLTVEKYNGPDVSTTSTNTYTLTALSKPGIYVPTDTTLEISQTAWTETGIDGTYKDCTIIVYGRRVL